MSDLKDASDWLEQHEIEYVELIVPDMAGMPRGKVQPVSDLSPKKFKLPVSIFGQTVTGDYYMPDDNVADRDMEIRPDLDTLRVVPWATRPTASVLTDCFDLQGKALCESPRYVLQKVLAHYAAEDWHPVVAPEVEYYLAKADPDAPGAGRVFDSEHEDIEELVDPYGFDKVNDLGELFEQLTEYCEIQNIKIGAVSQELGPGQFEINFDHGEPLKLADEVFHFKRTLKRVAQAHGLCASFIAKPDPEQAGSALHIHQSVYNGKQENIFANKDGGNSALFEHYLGGLQAYMREMLLMFAPYENSYRRFLSHFSSPINLEWGIDNRTTGLRVPESEAKARRVENRLPGSDVNPYLAIAGTLACGYLGMTKQSPVRDPIAESAYDVSFALYRHIYEAIDGFRGSEAVREMFGDEFVTTFSSVKEVEAREFQRRVPEWERGFMLTTL
ncbi:MAG: glutamine synthetase family protein [Pseudomonadota bacterium]